MGAVRTISAVLTRNQQAASQTLFQQGQQFAAAGDCQRAAERFRQALRLGMWIAYEDRELIQAALDQAQQQVGRNPIQITLTQAQQTQRLLVDTRRRRDQLAAQLQQQQANLSAREQELEGMRQALTLQQTALWSAEQECNELQGLSQGGKNRKR